MSETRIFNNESKIYRSIPVSHWALYGEYISSRGNSKRICTLKWIILGWLKLIVSRWCVKSRYSWRAMIKGAKIGARTRIWLTRVKYCANGWVNNHRIHSERRFGWGIRIGILKGIIGWICLRGSSDRYWHRARTKNSHVEILRENQCWIRLQENFIPQIIRFSLASIVSLNWHDLGARWGIKHYYIVDW